MRLTYRVLVDTRPGVQLRLLGTSGGETGRRGVKLVYERLRGTFGEQPPPVVDWADEPEDRSIGLIAGAT